MLVGGSPEPLGVAVMLDGEGVGVGVPCCVDPAVGMPPVGGTPATLVLVGFTIVFVGVIPGTFVAVAVGIMGVLVGVDIGVSVGTGRGVSVGVGIGVSVGVGMGVLVGVGAVVAVAVGIIGVFVGDGTMGVFVGGIVVSVRTTVLLPTNSCIVAFACTFGVRNNTIPTNTNSESIQKSATALCNANSRWPALFFARTYTYF